MDRRPDSRPRRRIGLAAVTLLVGASVCILLAAAVVRVRATVLASPSRVASTAPAAERTAVGAAVPVEPTGRSAAVPKGPVVALTGELQVASTTPGLRIFVDGHLAGAVPMRLQLSCGQHTVHAGNAWKTASVVVPCGGSVTLSL